MSESQDPAGQLLAVLSGLAPGNVGCWLGQLLFAESADFCSNSWYCRSLRSPALLVQLGWLAHHPWKVEQVLPRQKEEEEEETYKTYLFFASQQDDGRQACFWCLCRGLDWVWVRWRKCRQQGGEATIGIMDLLEILPSSAPLRDLLLYIFL